MQTGKPRARAGTVESVKDAVGRILYYRGKVRLQDGSCARVQIPEPKCNSETASRDFVAWAQEEEDEHHTIYRAKLAKQDAEQAAVAGAAGETCDAWYERFHAHKVELGRSAARDGRYAWKAWVSPRIGTKPMLLVTRSDVEDIRDALDVSVTAWKTHGRGPARISGKRAMNVWSALTGAFRAATGSKRRDLRILDGKPNPCLGVEPPGDRDSRKPRRKPFIFPAEFSRLMACDQVPAEWRELHAIAAFTYLRPGELRVLRWSDVDMVHGVISITRAWDSREDREKEPKTRNGVRTVPVHPNLMPLLKRMHEGAAETDGVVPLLGRIPEDAVAEHTRRHLRAAGIARPALYVDTATTVQVNFRSWRDSGITWLAMSGVGVDRIMRRAGHDAVQTTMGYVKQAEDMTGGELGEPFAPLPTSLVERVAGPPCGPPVSYARENVAERAGFETDHDRRLAALDQDAGDHADAEETKVTDAIVARPGDRRDEPVSATRDYDERRAETETLDPDAALRTAIKAAVDAGDVARASALLEVLKISTKPATVLRLATKTR